MNNSFWRERVSCFVLVCSLAETTAVEKNTKRFKDSLNKTIKLVGGIKNKVVFERLDLLPWELKRCFYSKPSFRNQLQP